MPDPQERSKRIRALLAKPSKDLDMGGLENVGGELATQEAEPEYRRAVETEARPKGITGKDLALAIPRGVTEAATSALNLALPKKLELENQLNVFGQADTAGGNLATGLAQFFIPYTGTKYLSQLPKVGKAFKWTKPNQKGFLARLGSEAGRGAVVDFTFFSDEENIANYFEGTSLENDLAEYLAIDSDDGDIERRLKSTLAGAGLGLFADTFIQGAGRFRRNLQASRVRDAAFDEKQALGETARAAEAEEVASLHDNMRKMQLERQERAAAEIAATAKKQSDALRKQERALEQQLADERKFNRKLQAQKDKEARAIEAEEVKRAREEFKAQERESREFNKELEKRRKEAERAEAKAKTQAEREQAKAAKKAVKSEQDFFAQAEKDRAAREAKFEREQKAAEAKRAREEKAAERERAKQERAEKKEADRKRAEREKEIADREKEIIAATKKAQEDHIEDLDQFARRLEEEQRANSREVFGRHVGANVDDIEEWIRTGGDDALEKLRARRELSEDVAEARLFTDENIEQMRRPGRDMTAMERAMYAMDPGAINLQQWNSDEGASLLRVYEDFQQAAISADIAAGRVTYEEAQKEAAKFSRDILRATTADQDAIAIRVARRANEDADIVNEIAINQLAYKNIAEAFATDAAKYADQFPDIRAMTDAEIDIELSKYERMEQVYDGARAVPSAFGRGLGFNNIMNTDMTEFVKRMDEDVALRRKQAGVC